MKQGVLLHNALRWLWSRRRWFYAAYVIVALTRIPARTGYRLIGPSCDMQLTIENARLSLTKVPHIVLFGIFFLLTVIQFDRIDRKAVSWAFVATVFVGLVVEFEESATRTGNCRLTDVLPDAVGALIAMTLLGCFLFIYRRVTGGTCV